VQKGQRRWPRPPTGCDNTGARSICVLHTPRLGGASPTAPDNALIDFLPILDNCPNYISLKPGPARAIPHGVATALALLSLEDAEDARKSVGWRRPVAPGGIMMRPTSI
jgi:hypothetical protein